MGQLFVYHNNDNGVPILLMRIGPSAGDGINKLEPGDLFFCISTRFHHGHKDILILTSKGNIGWIIEELVVSLTDYQVKK